MDFFDSLIKRRSAALFEERVPERELLERVLEVGLTVPDHGCLSPYRFGVVQGEARHRFAQALVDNARESGGELEPEREEKLRRKAYVAPVQVAIIFSPQLEHRIPLWEQQVTASCTGYAITLGAAAVGLGAVWKSVGPVVASPLQKFFQLKDSESLMGWVNLGYAKPKSSTPRTLNASSRTLWL